MSLRILHILDHSIPHQSGYAFRTLSILREQRALGWETFHLTTPKQGPTVSTEEDIDGWHFFRTPTRHEGDRLPLGMGELRQLRSTGGRLGQLARALRPTILHAHSPVLNVLPALWVGKRLGIPVVYELRALWEDAAVDHRTTTEGSLRYRVSRGLETFALSRADQVTTICEGLHRDIVSRGISPEKVTVIPNAVDTLSFHASSPPDAELRRSLGLDGTTVLGFVGSFYGYEGLDLLIDALKILLPTRPQTKLLLVGGGPEEANLKAKTKEQGLQVNVVFAGRVAHDQVQRYYDLIDLLVYPRRAMRLTDLVTPLKPLEAMAQGRVLIASDVGGHLELIRDRETGFLFRAGDIVQLAATIDKVLDCQPDWPRVRAAGRRFVENERTWARSVARYSDVYERALFSHRRALAA
jgi:PEP-CTERM/exosortase A-associated glycosyltransferase